MNALFEIGVSNALLACPLVLLAMVTSRLVRTPALTHALWLLVLLRLVSPPFLKLAVLPSERVLRVDTDDNSGRSATATSNSVSEPNSGLLRSDIDALARPISASAEL